MPFLLLASSAICLLLAVFGGCTASNEKLGGFLPTSELSGPYQGLSNWFCPSAKFGADTRNKCSTSSAIFDSYSRLLVPHYKTTSSFTRCKLLIYYGLHDTRRSCLCSCYFTINDDIVVLQHLGKVHVGG